VKDVEIEVLTKECLPTPSGPSKDGIVRFELELAANTQQEAKFVWELQAAAKVAGV
jgi:hypothetical protein